MRDVGKAFKKINSDARKKINERVKDEKKRQIKMLNNRSLNKTWFVYLLECADGSYYTGITNDIEKRMAAHKSGKGSKYVLAKGFGKLISSKSYDSRSEALKAEHKIKQLSKKIKADFFNSKAI